MAQTKGILNRARQVCHFYLVVAWVGAILVACQPAPPAKEPVVITFVIASYPWITDQAGEYERLAQVFHAAHPQVSVQVKPVDFSALSQDLAGADFLTDPAWGVDVLLVSADLLPALAEKNLLRDLGPALEGNLALEAQDFYPPALDLLRWKGQLFGLPAEIDPWVMFYNQERFDAASVPYPAGNWDWDGFLATARALKKAGSFAFGSWGAQVTPFIYQNGGQVVDDPMTPSRAMLTDPATLQAVQWYVDLALLEGVMPTPDRLAGYAVGQGRQQTIVMSGDAADKAAAQAQADLEQAVSGGDAALWMGRWSEGGGRWERWDFRWGVAPLPTGRQAATVASLQGYAILAHAEHFDAALQWVDFLTRQPPVHGGLPVRRSVAAGDAYRQQLRPEITGGLEACLPVLESGVVLPESLEWTVAEWLKGPLLAVLGGEMTVEAALAEAQQQAERSLSRP